MYKIQIDTLKDDILALQIQVQTMLTQATIGTMTSGSDKYKALVPEVFEGNKEKKEVLQRTLYILSS
jgi:hypothetical protein